MQLSPKRRLASAVDLTPLIDIIFQLVLFFMVSTQFVSSPGIEVDLPRSSADTILKERDDLKVWVRSDGSVYLNEAPISGGALRDALSEAARRDPNTMIIIKADKNVDHGTVVRVMDTARALGLSRLAIATEANTDADSATGAQP